MISAGGGASATHQGVLPEQRGDRVPLENRCGLVTSAAEGLLCRVRGRVEFPHIHCASKSGARGKEDLGVLHIDTWP